MSKISLVTGASRAWGDLIITYRDSAEHAAAVVDEIVAMGRKAVALQLDLGRAAL
ncbi:MAG TPA: hypothetical protein VM687_05215 [Stenotrophomonas sp.]|nr:hypothetical protein [Stenotrophomonas sp.]